MRVSSLGEAFNLLFLFAFALVLVLVTYASDEERRIYEKIERR